MKEDLIRIEQKLDLIIFALQEAKIMHKQLPSLDGIERDTCALCKKPIRLSVVPFESDLLRKCGCKLPKRALKLNINLGEPNANNRSKEDTIPSDTTEQSTSDS